MKECTTRDFSPEWISRDLGIDFKDILDILSEINLEETKMDKEEKDCNKNLESIIAIQ
jgi:hypothetical protein